jgi:CMP-N,N'-diacetyllegionaminic acid synthase
LYKKKKYLAVILARGGSKRLPGKNIKNLKGKPLIAYTILSASKCKYLDEIIVSSDDQKILDVSKKYCVKTIKRPKYLANDDAKSFDALKHVLKNNPNFDFVVLLQPTSPLRNEKHIYKAIELLEKKNAKAIISVCKSEQSLLNHNISLKNFSLQDLFKKNFLKKNTQDFKDHYKLNGAIYICEIKKFLKEKSLFLKKSIYAFEMHREESIDIDTKFDFEIAKTLIK